MKDRKCWSKNERRILNDSIKIKLNTLSEMRGLSKAEIINEALDVLLTIKKTISDVRKLGIYVSVEKTKLYPFQIQQQKVKQRVHNYYAANKARLYARKKELRKLKKLKKDAA